MSRADKLAETDRKIQKFVLEGEATEAEMKEPGVSTSENWVSVRRFLKFFNTVFVQATETVLGVAKAATQQKVDDGTDDATFITPKKLKFGCTFLIAANGYIFLPSWLGGLGMQWGRRRGNLIGQIAYNVDVTFPTPFPNECYAFIPAGGPNAADLDSFAAYRTCKPFFSIGQPQTTGVDMHLILSEPAEAAGIGRHFVWIAFGR